MNNQALIRPIISEKSMQDAQSGKFTFAFQRSARKEDIKKVIEESFSVHVMSLATSVVKGGRKRVGKQRREVRTSVWKRVIATLAKDEKISLFDIGEQK